MATVMACAINLLALLVAMATATVIPDGLATHSALTISSGSSKVDEASPKAFHILHNVHRSPLETHRSRYSSFRALQAGCSVNATIEGEPAMTVSIWNILVLDSSKSTTSNITLDQDLVFQWSVACVSGCAPEIFDGFDGVNQTSNKTLMINLWERYYNCPNHTASPATFCDDPMTLIDSVYRFTVIVKSVECAHQDTATIDVSFTGNETGSSSSSDSSSSVESAFPCNIQAIIENSPSVNLSRDGVVIVNASGSYLVDSTTPNDCADCTWTWRVCPVPDYANDCNDLSIPTWLTAVKYLNASMFQINSTVCVGSSVGTLCAPSLGDLNATYGQTYRFQVVVESESDMLCNASQYLDVMFPEAPVILTQTPTPIPPTKTPTPIPPTMTPTPVPQQPTTTPTPIPAGVATLTPAPLPATQTVVPVIPTVPPVIQPTQTPIPVQPTAVATQIPRQLPTIVLTKTPVPQTIVTSTPTPIACPLVVALLGSPSFQHNVTDAVLVLDASGTRDVRSANNDCPDCLYTWTVCHYLNGTNDCNAVDLPLPFRNLDMNAAKVSVPLTILNTSCVIGSPDCENFDAIALVGETYSFTVTVTNEVCQMWSEVLVSFVIPTTPTPTLTPAPVIVTSTPTPLIKTETPVPMIATNTPVVPTATLPFIPLPNGNAVGAYDCNTCVMYKWDEWVDSSFCEFTVASDLFSETNQPTAEVYPNDALTVDSNVLVDARTFDFEYGVEKAGSGLTYARIDSTNRSPVAYFDVITPPKCNQLPVASPLCQNLHVCDIYQTYNETSGLCECTKPDFGVAPICNGNGDCVQVFENEACNEDQQIIAKVKMDCDSLSAEFGRARFYNVSLQCKAKGKGCLMRTIHKKNAARVQAVEGIQKIVLSGNLSRNDSVEASDDSTNRVFSLSGLGTFSVLNATYTSTQLLSDDGQTNIVFTGATLSVVTVVAKSVAASAIRIQGGASNIFNSSTSTSINSMVVSLDSTLTIFSPLTSLAGSIDGDGLVRSSGYTTVLNPNAQNRKFNLKSAKSAARAIVAGFHPKALPQSFDAFYPQQTSTITSSFEICGNGPTTVEIPSDGKLVLRLVCADGGGPMQMTASNALLTFNAGSRIDILEAVSQTSQLTPRATQCSWANNMIANFAAPPTSSGTVRILQCDSFTDASLTPSSAPPTVTGCSSTCACAFQFDSGVLSVKVTCQTGAAPSPSPSEAVRAAPAAAGSSTDGALIGGLVGGLVGGFLLIVLLVALYVCFRNKKESGDVEFDRYVADPELPKESERPYFVAGPPGTTPPPTPAQLAPLSHSPALYTPYNSTANIIHV